MQQQPVSVHSSEMEDAFTASSRRVTRAFLVAQIREAEVHGVGECDWVNQMRSCVERTGRLRAEAFQARPALRLLP